MKQQAAEERKRIESLEKWNKKKRITKTLQKEFGKKAVKEYKQAKNKKKPKVKYATMSYDQFMKKNTPP